MNLKEQIIENTNVFFLKQGINLCEKRLHLAIFREPFLTKIFSGVKKIESRFSLNRCAPYSEVNKGDLVFIKKSAGKVVGAFNAETTDFFNSLNDDSLKNIKKSYKGLLGETEEFWSDKSLKNYATFIKVGELFIFPPFSIKKKDRRGWIKL